MKTNSGHKVPAAYRKEGTLESRRISAGKSATPEQEAAAADWARKTAKRLRGFTGVSDFLQKAEDAAEYAHEIGHELSAERAARLLWDIRRVRKALTDGADRFAILAAIDAGLVWAQLDEERRTSEELKRDKPITAAKYNRHRKKLERKGVRPTQERIAENLGVSPWALRKWLKAYSEPETD